MHKLSLHNVVRGEKDKINNKKTVDVDVEGMLNAEWLLAGSLCSFHVYTVT